MARVDYDEQSQHYDHGRSLPPEALQIWMATAKRYAPDATRILDLGAGTGRFSQALAETYDADVYAVEPSAGMRDRARTKPHDRVHVLAGVAEAIPLADSMFDLTWLWAVIHHLTDLDAAARDVRRVTRPGGTVFIAGAFAGTHVDSLTRFFPSAQDVIDTFESKPDVIAAFEKAGFSSFLSDRVRQLHAHSLGDTVERTRARADTALAVIPDDEFEQGLEHLEHAAKHEHGPVYDTLDVLVIR